MTAGSSNDEVGLADYFVDVLSDIRVPSSYTVHWQRSQRGNAMVSTTED